MRLHGGWSVFVAMLLVATGCPGRSEVPRPVDEPDADPVPGVPDAGAADPGGGVEPEAGSGGGSGQESAGPVESSEPVETAASGVPLFGTVFVVVLENMRFRSVIGNPEMPYVNGLAGRFALAGNYRTTSSPSLPNYLVMVAGTDFGVHNDGGPDSNGQDAPNLADQLEAAGVDWRAYMEGMGRPCQTRVGGTYAVKHNPFVYFRSVREDAALCAERDVPFDRFAEDLAAGPRRFTWISPDMNHNGHDTGPAAADAWLAETLPAILESPAWKDRGVLFLAWDEGNRGDDHIALLAISPLARPGHVSQAPYDHRSLLATIEDGLGLPRLETTAGVEPLADLFVTAGTGSGGGEL